MATTLAYGETVLVTMSIGQIVNEFTLNDPVLGLLNGTGVLDGNFGGIDITDFVMSADVRRGRSNELAAFEAGSATLLLTNNDRRFDPINESSPYWDNSLNRSGVQPRRRVTVMCQDELLFDGAISSISVAYDNQLSTCVIEAADDFVLLANQFTQNTFTPPIEISGARITSILDLPEIAYDATSRSIATGGKDLQAAEIEAGTNALSYLQECAKADQALLFVSRDGVLTFTDPLETVWFYEITAMFVDTFETPSLDTLLYTAINTITDQTFLYNKVIAGIDGGPEFTADDAVSQGQYGISTLSLTNLLLENDSDAQDLSAALLDRYKQPVYRFDDIEFITNGFEDHERSLLFSLEIGNTIEVVRTFTVGTPATVEAYYQVERLTHRITPNEHRIIVGLGDLKLVIFPFILDDAEYGILSAANALV